MIRTILVFEILSSFFDFFRKCSILNIYKKNLRIFMKWIKSSDFNHIVEIIVWRQWELRDKYFLAELFLKSWFNRLTIKFLLNLCETEIDFTTDILRRYCKNDDFLYLLQNILENFSLKMKMMPKNFRISYRNILKNLMQIRQKTQKKKIQLWEWLIFCMMI